jgi:hypothetical protein
MLRVYDGETDSDRHNLKTLNVKAVKGILTASSNS